MTSKDMFKNMTYESLEKQVGGNHYSKDENTTCTIY